MSTTTTGRLAGKRTVITGATGGMGRVACRMFCEAGARVIGVNNRNLKDFSVDLDHAARLRTLIPSDRLFVAESGVTEPRDAAALRAAGADAILVGEAMMRAEDKPAFLKAMRNAAEETG